MGESNVRGCQWLPVVVEGVKDLASKIVRAHVSRSGHDQGEGRESNRSSWRSLPASLLRPSSLFGLFPSNPSRSSNAELAQSRSSRKVLASFSSLGEPQSFLFPVSSFFLSALLSFFSLPRYADSGVIYGSQFISDLWFRMEDITIFFLFKTQL